jgi:uncharacterized protein with HEPN domain
MRNRLIHAYDDVDTEILWRTVKIALPDLVRSLERIVESDNLEDV